MGICCGKLDLEKLERYETLKEGSLFTETKGFLGLTTKEQTLRLQLNESCTRLICTYLSATLTKLKKTEIFLVDVGCVRATDELGILILSKSGKKLLQITAGDTATQQVWVQTLNEVISINSQDGGDTKQLNMEIAKQNEKDKESYWKKREADMAQRQKAAEQRKQQFASAGMKYTAQAMARRN